MKKSKFIYTLIIFSFVILFSPVNLLLAFEDLPVGWEVETGYMSPTDYCTNVQIEQIDDYLRVYAEINLEMDPDPMFGGRFCVMRLTYTDPFSQLVDWGIDWQGLNTSGDASFMVSYQNLTYKRYYNVNFDFEYGWNRSYDINNLNIAENRNPVIQIRLDDSNIEEGRHYTELYIYDVTIDNQSIFILPEEETETPALLGNISAFSPNSEKNIMANVSGALTGNFGSLLKVGGLIIATFLSFYLLNRVMGMFPNSKNRKGKKGRKKKKTKDDKIGKVMKKYGAFWAFGEKQFKEQKKEGVKYASLGAGLMSPVNNVDKLMKEIKMISKEKKPKKTKDETGHLGWKNRSTWLVSMHLDNTSLKVKKKAQSIAKQPASIHRDKDLFILAMRETNLKNHKEFYPNKIDWDQVAKWHKT